MSYEDRVLAIVLAGGEGTRLHPLTAVRSRTGSCGSALTKWYRVDVRQMIDLHRERHARSGIFCSVPMPHAVSESNDVNRMARPDLPRKMS